MTTLLTVFGLIAVLAAGVGLMLYTDHREAQRMKGLGGHRS